MRSALFYFFFRFAHFYLLLKFFHIFSRPFDSSCCWFFIFFLLAVAIHSRANIRKNARARACLHLIAFLHIMQSDLPTDLSQSVVLIWLWVRETFIWGLKLHEGNAIICIRRLDFPKIAIVFNRHSPQQAWIPLKNQPDLIWRNLYFKFPEKIK